MRKKGGKKMKRKSSKTKRGFLSFLEPLYPILAIGVAFSFFVLYFFIVDYVNLKYYTIEEYSTLSIKYIIGLSANLFYSDMLYSSVPILQFPFWITFVAFMLCMVLGWRTVSKYKRPIWHSFALGALGGMIAATIAFAILIVFIGQNIAEEGSYNSYFYIMFLIYIFSLMFTGIFGSIWSGFAAIAASLYK